MTSRVENDLFLRRVQDSDLRLEHFVIDLQHLASHAFELVNRDRKSGSSISAAEDQHAAIITMPIAPTIKDLHVVFRNLQDFIEAFTLVVQEYRIVTYEGKDIQDTHYSAIRKAWTSCRTPYISLQASCTSPIKTQETISKHIDKLDRFVKSLTSAIDANNRGAIPSCLSNIDTQAVEFRENLRQFMQQVSSRTGGMN